MMSDDEHVGPDDQMILTCQTEYVGPGSYKGHDVKGQISSSGLSNAMHVPRLVSR